MSEAVETNKGGLMVGLLIGGAVGMVTSLLIAPKSGSKLRQDLWSIYRSWQDKTSQLASTLSTQAEAAASKISEKTEDVMSSVSDTAKDITSTVSDKAKDIASTVSDKSKSFTDSGNNQH